MHNVQQMISGRCRPLLLLLVGLIQAVQPAKPVQAQASERPVVDRVAQKTEFVTGREFREALEKEITVGWQEEILRSGLAQLTAARQVAIMLDRRINPDQLVTLQIRKVSLLDMLTALAESVGGQLSVLENFVYIGPESAARRLRTLVTIRTSELLDGGPALTKRRFELFKRQAIEWSDLDRPSEILKQAADQFGVELVGAEQLPHDLWAATVLPESTAIEVLSAVLAQFDLTYEWQANASAIRIVPMPDNPLLERAWDVKSRPLRELAEKIPTQFPGVNSKLTGTQLVAQGSHEELEKINDVLYPKRVITPPRNRVPKTLTFTFHLRGTVGALMTGLEKQSDLRFQFDPQAIANAGVDLNHKVDVEMKNADIDELCHALFDTAKLSFTVDGTNIKVFPKP